MADNLPHVNWRGLHPGQVWRHYKGGVYQVVALARHSETLEPLVTYVRTDDKSVPRNAWCRPLMGDQGWFDPVLVGGPEGTAERFRRVR